MRFFARKGFQTVVIKRALIVTGRETAQGKDPLLKEFWPE